MEPTFVTALHIRKVRHLENIDIPLSSQSRKNLILTGENGSGKTSVLKAIVAHLEYAMSSSRTEDICRKQLSRLTNEIQKCDGSEAGHQKKLSYQKDISYWESELLKWTEGATMDYTSFASLQEKYQSGRFVLASFSDNRKIEVSLSKSIEKIDLKPVYTLKDTPSKDLEKYLVNLRTTQAFAQTKGDHIRAKQIADWFLRFEKILRDIYGEESLHLEFDIDTFRFSIHVDNREPFSFNTMSMGYAAVFDIIGDLILRMETQRNYDMEGIVLVDEIETHLHVALQKKIIPILTDLFPNLQFILTTHSPFILNSAPNSVVYDLENRMLVKDGLTNLPYEGIVKGYFDVDTLSMQLREKFEQYRSLVEKQQDLTDAEYAEIAELELYLDDVPDYLAPEFAAEYQRLNTEFHQ